MPSKINDGKFVIKGLAGARTLAGELRVNGAKNDALKAMAAAALFDGPVTLLNIPDTEDIKKMTILMEALGIRVEKKPDPENPTGHALVIDASGISSSRLDPEIAKSMRGSVVITGPILARLGRVSFPAPGGCVIGARPIDLFAEGYKKMGARVEIQKDSEGNDVYEMTAPEGGLCGAEIIFPIQTVGGTETLMMAAILARGKTVLKNCAMEPEIVNLAEYLVLCGAQITGIGTTTIEIEGIRKMSPPARPYRAIPDRIEAGSFLLLSALCGRDVTILDCNPAHLEVVIALLRDSGVSIETVEMNEKNGEKNGAGFIRVRNTGDGHVKNKFLAFNIRTHEYPGFPTDLQAQAVVFLTQAAGTSTVFETIFEGRFKYTSDLSRMGAQITVMNPREISITGPTGLHALGDGQGSEELCAYDIRAGFAAVMAALSATGTSVINTVYYIDRGYERLPERLAALGADIKRID